MKSSEIILFGWAEEDAGEFVRLRPYSFVELLTTA